MRVSFSLKNIAKWPHQSLLIPGPGPGPESYAQEQDDFISCKVELTKTYSFFALTQGNSEVRNFIVKKMTWIQAILFLATKHFI